MCGATVYGGEGQAGGETQYVKILTEPPLCPGDTEEVLSAEHDYR